MRLNLLQLGLGVDTSCFEVDQIGLDLGGLFHFTGQDLFHSRDFDFLREFLVELLLEFGKVFNRRFFLVDVSDVRTELGIELFNQRVANLLRSVLVVNYGNQRIRFGVVAYQFARCALHCGRIRHHCGTNQTNGNARGQQQWVRNHHRRF